jgi:hypothetical protein
MRRDAVHPIGIDGQRFQGGAREILAVGVQLLHDVIRKVQPNSHVPSIEHGTVSGQLRVVAADPGSSISGSATQSCARIGFEQKNRFMCRFSEGWDPRFSKPFPPDLFPRLRAIRSVPYRVRACLAPPLGAHAQRARSWCRSSRHRCVIGLWKCGNLAMCARFPRACGNRSVISIGPTFPSAGDRPSPMTSAAPFSSTAQDAAGAARGA